MRKASPCMDFKEHFGKINPREPRQDLIAQFDQAGRFIELIEPGQREGIAPLTRFDPNRRIGRKVFRSTSISGIQLMRQTFEFRFR